MRAYLAAFVMAAIIAVALTPLVRGFAIRVGAMDTPGHRSVHSTATPRLGGVAIFFAVVATILSLFFVESSVARAIQADPLRIGAILLGGVGMAALGVFDDFRGLRPTPKLFAQVVAGCLVFASGLRIDAILLPFIGPLEMGIFALPITVFWIVGVVNAVNLIDGLDGLAAGIVFFAALTNLIVAWVTGSIVVGAFMASMLGALLGFLFFNFNPARIFMGDSGSYFLGFFLACSALMGAAQKASTSVALLAPVIALGVPIFDTLFTITRRFLERRPVFSADRGHLHHRLLDIGMTHRRAVLVLYGISVLFMTAAIGISLGRNWQVGLALCGATAVVVGLVRFVGVIQHQRLRIQSADTQNFRRDIPDLLVGLQNVNGLDEALAFINEWGPRTSLGSLELTRNFGDQVSCLASWRNETAVGRRLASAEFRMTKPVLDNAQLKISWVSMQSDISPQDEILLLLLSDAFEAAAVRNGAVPTHPNSDGAIEADPIVVGGTPSR